MTQSKIILKVLRSTTEWVPSYNLQKVNTEWGFLGTSADRAARKLAENGEIERKQVGKYAYYRATQPVTIKEQVAYNPDGTIHKIIRTPIY